MKQLFTILTLAMLVAFAGCSKDEEDNFDYDLSLLFGKWRVTHVKQSDGSYLDVTTSIAEAVFKPTYATFSENGSYSGSGEFGTGSGTYKTTGKTIITYISGEEYLRYEVISLNGTNAELRMYEKGDDASIYIKVEKQ